MGNLGLSNAVTAEVQSPMEELTNQLVGRNTQYAQDARTNIGNWGAQHNVLYGDQEVNARGAQAFQQGAFQGQVGNALSKSQLDASEQQYKFASALQALMGQRGGFEVEYAQGLADRDSQRNLQIAEMESQANRAQAELEARAQEFAATQAARANEMNINQGRWQAELGLDTRKQDFAELMAMAEQQGAGADPWASGGVLGMRQMAQQLGNPEYFNQAQELLNMASADPRSANGNVGQIATEMLKTTPYGRSLYKSVPTGTGYTQSYDDLLDMIALGTGR
jgi:hypothetical protein